MVDARTKVEDQENATTPVWCSKSILKGTERRTPAALFVSRPGLEPGTP